ncbi:MAG: acyl-CoA dehydratase activase [Candidatus Cloacimonetes bacterium]|jgi:predicted CoA-substrate-specific enzyme activase|nr:acyl-CoA dehydratase activase [Candidatus Cloacimonadota bacterium]MDY0336278.1 acyl-CoA dehydratase activase [Candidatus Cloacimonadaceae bacterium]MDD3096105.1 acyl-CoA dehydratase activase [Candidatus Cloacimonadota bacterium]MDD3577785.1 acyl-CoA dehydratase activase [Candidatus Cloacimonadota bacterium]MDD4033798.1 acyl-CoA dehydratase activase [Candidatus Cloacimonadota bacterium]
MYSLGIDIGSRNTKIVIWNPQERTIIWQGYQSTEVSALAAVEKLLVLAASDCDLSKINKECVTGYGRKLYNKADKVLSEITCHASGCYELFPAGRTIIDIGGQDSKIISLEPAGGVKDFVMNDKCAAGTGRFLEMTALRLECSLHELSTMADQSDMELQLNSTCVVFAESEIIGLLAEGNTQQNIAHAVFMSIAKRIYAQMAGLSLIPSVVFTGGVAKSTHLKKCLETLFGTELLVPFEPEISGALGAAILA